MATRVTDRAGQVLGGRYRLVAPIGTGASASVYLAEDTTLRRRVAVKVLHDALADDEAFLRRFQAEAHAAAALNHPNVMSVFDWSHGGGNEVAFLVMEYLSGGNLKTLLDGGYRLSLSQALLVGLEAARGLDYAHRRGFVHRDVKPANLLFDEEGRLRIADFGLARALAEAAWTEPMGAVLGTARYASPEQARGEPLDGRSDVYSLALVLVECVTGLVPFAADTTLGTLMARVDKPLPVPDELGPLAPVLRAAGAPDPGDRLDADGLGRALLRAAEHLDPPLPLPLVHTVPTEVPAPAPDDITAVIGGVGAIAAAGSPDPVGAAVADTDLFGAPAVVPDAEPDVAADLAPPLSRAERRAARKALPEDGDAPPLDLTDGAGMAAAADDPGLYEAAAWQGSGGSPSPTLYDHALDPDLDSDHGVRIAAPTATMPGAESPTAVTPRPEGDPFVVAPTAAATAPPGRGTKPPATKRRRRRRWLVALVVLVVLAGSAAGAWAYVGWQYHEVPNVVGQPVAAAESAAADAGWQLVPTERFDETQPAGTVLEQTPVAGQRLGRDETFAVVVSSGPPPVPVPGDLVGRPVGEATDALAALGLRAGSVPAFDEEVPADHVIALAPGTPPEVTKGGEVVLIVSQGPEPRTIPGDLVGSTLADVRERLEALGLDVSPVEQFDETVPAGIVFWLDPAAGEQVPRGSTVSVGVSKGPPTVVVPDVSGMTVVEAADALEAAGLVVSGTQGSPRQDVASTSPAAGTTVKKGTSVTIITGGANNDD